MYVRNQLKFLKREKATRLDQLPSSLLKDWANEITIPLAYIIILSLYSSTLHLFHQVGREQKSFRFSKVEALKTSVTTDRYLFYPCQKSWRAVFTQLSEYLETNKLLTNCQFGYRSKRSTECERYSSTTLEGRLIKKILLELYLWTSARSTQ